jgi:uncharacterized protein YjdB
VVLAGTIVGVADTATLSATVLVNGAETDSVPLQWTSSNSAIAVVDSTGMVRGRARGTAVITAEIIGGSVTSDSAGDSDSVWVVAASLELAPDDSTITAVDDTLCLRHVARDAGGESVEGTAPVYSIQADPDSTVRLTANGCVVGRASGASASVAASLDTVTAAVGVTVRQTVTTLVLTPDSTELMAINAIVQLDAQATDLNGNPVPDRLITWTSSDPAVADVDSTGKVTARNAGSAGVWAAADDLADTARIVVNPPVLTVTPSSVSSSAAEGSAATHTQYVKIENTGSGSPTWMATTTDGSLWLTLFPLSGGMPDSVLLTLTPAGLDPNTYRDTVVVTVLGASGSPAKVSVTYTITGCATTPINPDTEINGTLTADDCGAPNRPSSFAKIYTFSGSLGDTIRLSLAASFDPYLILADETGAKLTENDVCSWNTSRACIDEYVLPGSGTYRIEATTRDPGATGSFTLQAVEPTAPIPPQNLRQRESDGTPITNGGRTADLTVLLRASVSDTDPGDTLRLEVEVLPPGQTFGDTATHTGDSVLHGDSSTVTVSLQDNTAYRWQARVVDRTDRSSTWEAFPANPAFVVNVADESPSVPGADLNQTILTDTSVAIPLGDTTTIDGARFKATVTDPDPGDLLRLQVEVQPIGTSFVCTNVSPPTCAAATTGLGVPSGIVAQVPVVGLTDGPYHWQVRVIDSLDNTSAWVSFPQPPNPESEADFVVDQP